MRHRWQPLGTRRLLHLFIQLDPRFWVVYWLLFELIQHVYWLKLRAGAAASWQSFKLFSWPRPTLGWMFTIYWLIPCTCSAHYKGVVKVQVPPLSDRFYLGQTGCKKWFLFLWGLNEPWRKKVVRDYVIKKEMNIHPGLLTQGTQFPTICMCTWQTQALGANDLSEMGAKSTDAGWGGE